MPRLGGPEATERIRAMGFTGIIIALTGNALEEDVKVFLDKGADAVMTKPLNKEEFKRQVLSLRANRANKHRP